MSAPIIEQAPLMKSHWSEQERTNAQVVLDFVQLLMNDHNFEALRNQHQNNPYKQHNRTMSDGIEGVLSTIADLVKKFPTFSYDVKRVFVDGDEVIIHAHATLKAAHRGDDSQGMNIVDIWKLADGIPVEHWDAVQGLSLSMRLYGLLTGGKVANSNGVF